MIRIMTFCLIVINKRQTLVLFHPSAISFLQSTWLMVLCMYSYLPELKSLAAIEESNKESLTNDDFSLVSHTVIKPRTDLDFIDKLWNSLKGKLAGFHSIR